MIKQYIEVIEETDWIVRGFDPDSIPIIEAIIKPKTAIIRQLMIDALFNKQSTIEQEIKKKLNKNSANLHWSETNNKILIIDMQ